MFDFVHKNKLAMQVILGLIAITFAFWGVESYTTFRGASDSVATVNGLSISKRELEEELRRQQDRLREALGRGFDSAAFDTPEVRRALLESLIAQRVIASAALQANLMVSDEALREAIAGMPVFQGEGGFSKSSYELALRSQNPPLTPAQFEARLRRDLSLAQLARAVAEAAIPSRTAAERLAALLEQKREIAEARIAAQPYAAQVKLDAVKLKAYYDANQAEFRTPERVRAQYVVLSADELAKQDAVSEAELKAAYDARASQYQVEEQRRASHILAKTKQEAERLLAEARKFPASFAELARRHSQDSGSAAKGGDLGLVGRGMMVKPFEDAVFRMKEGEIAGPVESEFGFHIIRLVAVQSGRSRSFEEVRKELGAELARQKGAKRFAEAAEAFGNLVYEQSDSLAPAAQRFKLAIRQSDWIARQPGRAAGPLDHPKVLAALFAQDAIQGRRNTDAIEVAPNVLVAARVAAHQPAAQRKFEEVRSEIEQRLLRQEAAKLAYGEGAAKLALLGKRADAGLKWSAPRAISVRDAQALPPEALRKVFAADAHKLPLHVGIDRPRGAKGQATLRSRASDRRHRLSAGGRRSGRDDPRQLLALPQIGRSPHDGDEGPDEGNVGVAIRHGLGPHLDDPDHGGEGDEVPRPSRAQPWP